MTPEERRMDPALERAVSEIRDEAIPDEVVDAAAARVWARLSTAHPHIRSCADFQALIPEFRSGRLPEARALLLKDHLHECVACRRVFEGKIVAMAAVPARTARRESHSVRWAMAAGIVPSAH